MIHFKALLIPEDEIEWHAIRAQGAGGQNVNKVSSAVHLRFDIHASSLPDETKQALLHWPDARISSEGVVIIKAQSFRSQDKNYADAVERLHALVRNAAQVRKKRTPTKPTQGARKKRLESKNRRGTLKQLRGRVA